MLLLCRSGSALLLRAVQVQDQDVGQLPAPPDEQARQPTIQVRLDLSEPELLQKAYFLLNLGGQCF